MGPGPSEDNHRDALLPAEEGFDSLLRDSAIVMYDARFAVEDTTRNKVIPKSNLEAEYVAVYRSVLSMR